MEAAGGAAEILVEKTLFVPGLVIDSEVEEGVAEVLEGAVVTADGAVA